MIGKAFELTAKAGAWLSSKANRLRLRGARIQVVVLLVSRSSKPKLMLARSVYHDIWMPPQEGVAISEGFKDAVVRCLRDECGIANPENENKLPAAIHLRSFRYLGTLPLSASRLGERMVADDAVGTAFENVALTQKAYWAALLIVSEKDPVQAVPDMREVNKIDWLTFEDAKKIVARSNHKAKGALLIEAIEACQTDVTGGKPPSRATDEVHHDV